MDSHLKSNLKTHFKNYSMLLVDIDGLFSKYKNLTGSLYTSPSGIYLNLSGTIPYLFSGFVYKAPVLIRIPPDYPFSPPMMFVTPSESIKIVRNHPNVHQGGIVTLPYLDKWNHTSKLVHAVDALHKAFNIMSPIYSPTSPKQILADQGGFSDEVPYQCKPEALFAKHKLSDRDRNLVEHSYQNILTNLKNNRQNIVKQYQYDMNKYEIHRKVLMNWPFALLELNNINLKLDEFEAKLEKQLKEDELNKVQEIYDEIDTFLISLTNSRQTLDSLEDEHFRIEDVLKFEDQDSQKLSELIVNEASCRDMLEFLHETHKNSQISTKYYVQEMRKLSHELFLSKLEREKILY